MLSVPVCHKLGTALYSHSQLGTLLGESGGSVPLPRSVQLWTSKGGVADVVTRHHDYPGLSTTSHPSMYLIMCSLIILRDVYNVYQGISFFSQFPDD